MNILLVDDDTDSRAAVGQFLADLGHKVVECENGEEALKLYTNESFPMILSDIKMPKMTGLELLQEITKMPQSKVTSFVLFTGFGDMETAIKALKSGAYDYLLKPINVEELALVTERIAEHHALREENKKLTTHFEAELSAATEETQHELKKLKKTVAKTIGLSGIGVFSESMNKIVQLAQKYHTDRSIPVFIQGETGTGKEVVAKLIHFNEMHEYTPFIDINCAALTPSLFESELFGYEAGSFTGGLSKGQKGKIDLAKGGTLFLDEVAEIPLDLQGKLLRVIQEKEFYRVGGLKKIQTDVRIICATNLDIEKRVAEGSFREDLYYRLKVGHIQIPPLRERLEDIIPLAKLFLQEFSRQKGKNFDSISQSAAEVLLKHCWPGNVRELRNVIEWATFMFDEIELQPYHLGLIDNKLSSTEIAASSFSFDIKNIILPKDGLSLDALILSVITKALELNKGNKSKTAQYLGITRRSLYSKLKGIIK